MEKVPGLKHWYVVQGPASVVGAEPASQYINMLEVIGLKVEPAMTDHICLRLKGGALVPVFAKAEDVLKLLEDIHRPWWR